MLEYKTFKGVVYVLVLKTKEEFDNIVELIRKNVEQYENYMTEVRYKLYLANKKVLDIYYEKDSIPHLLGVNLDFIRSLNCYREKSAYELLKAFLNDSYKVYSKLEDLGRVFSDYVMEKNEIFKDNLKIVLNDIECIVEYRKDRVYGLETVECPCEYYILQKRNDRNHNIILLQGIVRKGNVYVPQTSQKVDLTKLKDIENIRNILFHQNITFVNSLRYSNNYDTDSKVFYMDFQSKIDKLLVLNRYASQNESTIVVDGDYGYTLKRLNETYMNQNKIKSTLQTISSTINTGDIIDMGLLEEDTDCDILDVVKAYNNSRFKETNSFKYSELLEEYNRLKNLVIDLQNRSNDLEQENNLQKEEIKKLSMENENYKDNHQKILTILQKTTM